MISTHILDTSLGVPATDVTISLEKKDNQGNWNLVGKGHTNSDGRLAFDCPKELGIYRLNFEIENYYKKRNADFFFLDIPVIFQVTSIDRKYHVPLLLNPYGHTIYRGS